MEKLMFAKLLGEIYRTQKRIDPNLCTARDAEIYGLLNGFEPVIDRQLSEVGWITDDEITAVADVLQPYFDDEEKLNGLKGYYQIEFALRYAGIPREKAIAILTYFKANEQYTDVIKKLNSDASPIECKRFDIPDWNK